MGSQNTMDSHTAKRWKCWSKASTTTNGGNDGRQAILAVPLKDSDSEDVFVTLPSNADLKVYISEFPAMQTNIICDSYGYYIIDIIDAAEQNKSPLPAGAKRIMTEFRQRPDIQKRVFSEGGFEYYRTTLKEWKHRT